MNLEILHVFLFCLVLELPSNPLDFLPIGVIVLCYRCLFLNYISKKVSRKQMELSAVPLMY